MKVKIDKRFVVEIGHDDDCDRRSHFDEEIKSKIGGTDKLVQLVDSCGVVAVYHSSETGRFLVQFGSPKGAKFPDGIWPGQVSVWYFDDILDALIYACLMTTCPTIDAFIREFGTEHIAKFVGPKS